MLVVDASAVVASLVEEPPPVALRARLCADGDLHAPHLLDVEVVSALRGLTLRGELAVQRAEAALGDFASLVIVRYPQLALIGRIWELRERVSAYDAAYVSLAEELGVPLVTVDERLARTRGHQAFIEVPAGA